MQKYAGFIIYYKEQPFLYIADNQAENVQNFIKDYCASNQMQLLSTEWIIIPCPCLISKKIISAIAPPQQQSDILSQSKWRVTAGDVGTVMVNKRCFD